MIESLVGAWVGVTMFLLALGVWHDVNQQRALNNAGPWGPRSPQRWRGKART
jgi:hypothetical protein